jgi:hypothetical protein
MQPVFMPVWTSAAGIDRGNHNFFGVGRLADSVPVRQASSELASIAADLERMYQTSTAAAAPSCAR